LRARFLSMPWDARVGRALDGFLRNPSIPAVAWMREAERIGLSFDLFVWADGRRGLAITTGEVTADDMPDLGALTAADRRAIGDVIVRRKREIHVIEC